MNPLQKVAFKLDISASSGGNPDSAGKFGMMQDIPFRSVKASYMSSNERLCAQYMGLLQVQGAL